MRDYYSFPILKSERHGTPMMLEPSYDVPRYRWLAWLLRRLGLLKASYHTDWTSTYTRVDISSHSMVEVLREGLSSIQRMRLQRPKRVYVGFDQFDNLMQDEGVVRHSVQCDPMTWPVKVYGAEIIMTPYLDGILPVWEGDQ